jgi:hypothetical protein
MANQEVYALSVRSRLGHKDKIAMRSLGHCGEIFLILSGNPLEKPLEKLDRFLYFELTCF